MALEAKKTHVQVATLVESRYEGLKGMLVARQRDMLNELLGKIRCVRTEGPHHSRVVLSFDDASDAETQDDLEFALIQMKAETLNKIDEALVRLEDGRYGLCYECGEEIAQPRLRALPFAVRCRDCEEAIEMAQQRARAQARRNSSTLRFEMGGGESESQL